MNKPHLYSGPCPSCQQGLPLKTVYAVNVVDRADGKQKIMMFNKGIIDQLLAMQTEKQKAVETEEPKVYANLDDFAKAHGFVDETEFHRLNSCLDLTTWGARTAHRRWQDKDGSKVGLLDLIERYGVKP